MNEQIHFNHWTRVDRMMLRRAGTFRDMSDLALNIMHRMPESIEMVSGPISTGGVGNIPGNRKVFERAIELLVGENRLNIFSQMPFEDKMVEFYLAWHATHPKEKYCTPILTDFYERIFSTGKVKIIHFIHGWESSYGASWEHENCDRWKIRRFYLSEMFSRRALEL